MTVGMYLNSPLPIVITDCLALPRNGTGVVYSPSNIESYYGKPGQLAQLVSKFMFADDQTLIAFAGGSNSIIQFARGLPSAWGERNPDLRPMQFLHGLDVKLRETYDYWDCAVLGACVVSNGKRGCMVNNYASVGPHWRFSTKHFGDCYSVGSGAEELRKFIETADQNLNTYGNEDADFFWKLVGALNGKALFQQNEAVEKQTWGGLLQVQAFSPEEGIWARTPSWFHLCLVYRGKNLVYKGLHPKTVLHLSKDRNTSAVITTVTFPDGAKDIVIWPVYPLPQFNDDDECLSVMDLVQRPEFVTITVEVQDGSGTRASHHTFPTGYVEGLHFSSAPESEASHDLKLRMEMDVLSSWLRDLLLKDKSFVKRMLDI